SLSLSHPYRLSCLLFFFLMLPRPPCSTLFPYTTLFRSRHAQAHGRLAGVLARGWTPGRRWFPLPRSWPAPDAHGVPAAGGQRRGNGHARVRAGPRRARSGGRVARTAARDRGQAQARHGHRAASARPGDGVPRPARPTRGLAGDVRPAGDAPVGRAADHAYGGAPRQAGEHRELLTPPAPRPPRIPSDLRAESPLPTRVRPSRTPRHQEHPRMGKDKKKDKHHGHVRAVPSPPSEATQARNPGMPLSLDWVRDVRVNRSAVERRAATIPTRRSVKKEWQAAWYLRAIACTDLTTLAGDDTPGRVRRLCAKARRPVRQDLLDAMGAGELDLRVAAVCVYHEMIPTAVDALEGSGIPVAAVAAGFPAGLSPLHERIKEVEASVAAGAEEIDIVINRAHL